MALTNLRFQFVPRVVKGVMNGASLALPTGSGQMLYYEIIDGSNQPNSLGYQGFAGMGKSVGVIAYDWINARWSCLFTASGVSSQHANTTYENDSAQILQFIATLTSPPVPQTDEAGNDVPWPAAIPVVLAS